MKQTRPTYRFHEEVFLNFFHFDKLKQDLLFHDSEKTEFKNSVAAVQELIDACCNLDKSLAA